jgi:hypothetical protein
VNHGEGEGDGNPEKVAVGASVLGYFSAVCYLGARIPQILKNYRDKSCEGEFIHASIMCGHSNM